MRDPARHAANQRAWTARTMAGPDTPQRRALVARRRRQAAVGRRRRYETLAQIKLAAGCVDCGYAAHSEALDFDHRPDEVKEFDIARGALARKLAWSRIEAEMGKCDIVCANCHRVRTAERAGRPALSVVA